MKHPAWAIGLRTLAIAAAIGQVAVLGTKSILYWMVYVWLGSSLLCTTGYIASRGLRHRAVGDESAAITIWALRPAVLGAKIVVGVLIALLLLLVLGYLVERNVL